MHGVRSSERNRRLVVIAAIAAIAVLLSACGPAPPAAGGLVGAINAQRAARGLPRLTSDGGLTIFANGWVGHLAEIGALEHQDLSVVPGWNALGETVEDGPCGQTDQSIVAAWMNSPSHAVILMSPAYRLVGVAKLCGADGQEWVVAEFGG